MGAEGDQGFECVWDQTFSARVGQSGGARRGFPTYQAICCACVLSRVDMIAWSLCPPLFLSVCPSVSLSLLLSPHNVERGLLVVYRVDAEERAFGPGFVAGLADQRPAAVAWKEWGSEGRECVRERMGQSECQTHFATPLVQRLKLYSLMSGDFQMPIQL